jgi:hypothetical protein
MGWRKLIGNMLESLDSPSAPLGSAEDPFNRAVQASLNASSGSAATAQEVQRTFPGTSAADAARVEARAEALGKLALETYYQVRDGAVTEAAAEAKIKAAYPDLSEANFRVLRARCHMATSK